MGLNHEKKRVVLLIKLKFHVGPKSVGGADCLVAAFFVAALLVAKAIASNIGPNFGGNLCKEDLVLAFNCAAFPLT